MYCTVSERVSFGVETRLSQLGGFWSEVRGSGVKFPSWESIFGQDDGNAATQGGDMRVYDCSRRKRCFKRQIWSYNPSPIGTSN